MERYGRTGMSVLFEAELLGEHARIETIYRPNRALLHLPEVASGYDSNLEILEGLFLDVERRVPKRLAQGWTLSITVACSSTTGRC
jgi:hypothetical protein